MSLRDVEVPVELSPQILRSAGNAATSRASATGQTSTGTSRHDRRGRPAAHDQDAVPVEEERQVVHGVAKRHVHHADAEHDHCSAIHNSEPVKDHSHERLLIRRSVLESFHSPIEAVSEPNAPEIWRAECETIPLLSLVRHNDPVITSRRL